ncbi:MAG: hypothetical protein KGS10_12925 [Chloroflexi bacterium]|nr:hypothetical protein [Chloroflexota bacterium]NCA13493.1 hypothetical protein [Pseudomonadota bacterium]
MAGVGLDPRAAALLVHRTTTRRPGDGREWLGDDPEADAFLRGDGTAMLLGLVLQRGMPAERVWRIPLHLYRQLGHLDPSRLAEMPIAEVESALRRLPARPRYPGQSAATVVALGRLVRDQFRGDGTRVWSGRRMADVLATLMSLPGVGPGIAHMAVQELMDEVGYSPHPDELPGLDVKADVHVVRVFFRLGIASDETRDAALDAARRLHPTFPGLLDWPAWDIGRRLCRPHSPACGECPLIAVCERRGVGETHQGIRAVPDQHWKPETAPQGVTNDHGRTVDAPVPDDEFWRLLAGLLGVALQSARSDGVAHRLASVAPHLIVDPALAWTQCRAVANDILAERLLNTNLAPDVDVVGEAVRFGIINPMEAAWLRECFGGQPPVIRLADSVTLIIQAIRALG